MPEREPLDVLDAIHSPRAMRYLKPDPIPDGVLWTILDAAIRGPTGGNAQSWGWVVVRDPQTKRRIAGWYREGWERAYGQDREQQLAQAALGEGGLGRANYLSAEYLANHLEEAPVWIFPVLRNAAGSTRPTTGSLDLRRGAEPHARRVRPRHRLDADLAVRRPRGRRAPPAGPARRRPAPSRSSRSATLHAAPSASRSAARWSR